MKKSIILFATLMVCIAMALCVSCSKDDDKSSSNPVVGTWEGSINDDFDIDIICDFYNDNTGKVTMMGEDYYGDYQINKYDFTYKMYGDDEGYIIVEREDYYYGTEYERVDFELNEKIMYIYSNDEYYGNELICVLHKQ